MLKRYLAIIGIILAVLFGLGVWLKPPMAAMREGVEEGLTAYAAKRLAAGEAIPKVSHTESGDWLVAVSHAAKVGEETFYCVGAFKVTVCNSPD